MVQSWAVPAQTLVYAFRHLPRKAWPAWLAGLFLIGLAGAWTSLPYFDARLDVDL